MLGYKSTKRFDRVYTSPLFFYSEQDYIKKSTDESVLFDMIVLTN